MATAAQIEANRRNSAKSTGPKTAAWKYRARCNAYKHGMAARTIMPVLPQEDPDELEERTQEYISDLQPRNAIERDLVRQAARLSYAMERAERIETAHLAGRVREAAQTEQLSARQLEQVHELGRRLLYIAGPEAKSYPNPPWDDEPAVFVRGLEETAGGCRWLLARWAEFRNLLSEKSWWGMAPFVRFIRLQGKHPVEAFYDPALNSIFLAWEVLAPKTIEWFWSTYQKSPTTSTFDPAYRHLLWWYAMGPRPETKQEAWAILHGVVDRHIDRLEAFLAQHEAITADEAAARADRAALDCSKEFERHRRYQSARTRELLRTLDTLRKMQKEKFRTGNGEEEMADGKCQMANGNCQMANDEGQMTESELQGADIELKMTDEQCDSQRGGCDESQRLEPMTEGSSGPVVEYDPTRVTDDLTHDKIGILSHPGTEPEGRLGQGDDARQSLPCGVMTPQEALNKANPESPQSSKLQALKLKMAGAEGWKQSQSAGDNAPCCTVHPARLTPTVASESEGRKLLRLERLSRPQCSADLESAGIGRSKGRPDQASDE
jgi:hypothetical protein